MPNPSVPESWKPVEGYEGRYEVSDAGRVRSLLTGKVLKTFRGGRGYLSVSLRRDGEGRTTYVHHLVARAFIGPRPTGLDICHQNGDVTDARASNLRYGTRNSNMRDAIAHGTHRSVRQTVCARGHALTDDNIYVSTSLSTDGAIKTRRRCKTCQRDAVSRYRASR